MEYSLKRMDGGGGAPSIDEQVRKSVFLGRLEEMAQAAVNWGRKN